MILLNLLSFFAVATEQAVPGTRIPLQLHDFEFKVMTPLLPIDWFPTHVRWILYNPYGKEIYFVDGRLSSVTLVDKGYEGAVYYSIWKVSADSGYLKIPAFAQPGEWVLKVKFYKSGNAMTLYTIPVTTGSIFDSLSAPLYFIIRFNALWGALTFEQAIQIELTTFALIVMGFVILILLVLILRRR